MKLFVTVALALVAVAAAQPALDLETFHAFQSYTHRFNKVYDSMEEYNLRMRNYAASMQRVATRRQVQAEETGMSADEVFGETKFSDLSPEEFKKTYLGFKPHSPDRRGQVVRDTPVYEGGRTINALPEKLDWRTKGVVGDVRNQGQCGSCWAWSCQETVASAWAMQGNPLVELSTQQIVSCDQTDGGCNGGDTTTAYDYIKQTGGLETAADYPYTSGGGNSGQCMDQHKYKVTVTNYTYATPPCQGSCDNQDEQTLARSLVAAGPISICVDAEPWQDYTGGVLSSGCAHGYYDLDHCVQLVVLNREGVQPYWGVRNSWGEDWGYNGYIHIAMGNNVCGIADEATIPGVAAAGSN